MPAEAIKPAEVLPACHADLPPENIFGHTNKLRFILTRLDADLLPPPSDDAVCLPYNSESGHSAASTWYFAAWRDDPLLPYQGTPAPRSDLA